MGVCPPNRVGVPDSPPQQHGPPYSELQVPGKPKAALHELEPFAKQKKNEFVAHGWPRAAGSFRERRTAPNTAAELGITGQVDTDKRPENTFEFGGSNSVQPALPAVDFVGAAAQNFASG